MHMVLQIFHEKSDNHLVAKYNQYYPVLTTPVTMYVRLLVSVLFLSAISSATYVINVDDYLEYIRNVPVTPRDFFDVKSFLTSNGYPFENHAVTTEDGYVLSLHRIPHGKDQSANQRKDKTKPAVLMMHGLLDSSVDFFIFGPEKSLAMMLADLGYDVWLGNNRGNTYSRKHITMDPDENATFWDYSFHELGAFDVPASIDYILNATQNEKLTYVGHSQGCTQFFVTTSLRPEYNDKITIMVAFGPPVFIHNMTNPIVQTMATLYSLVELAFDKLNITEVLPYTSLSTALQIICSEDSGFQELCVTFFFLLFGFDTDQLNRATLPVVFQNLPAGSSAKEILHFLQEVKSGHFRQYDYGEATNLKIYNSSAPPDYNLSLVTAPVALYYGGNDWLVSLPDIDILKAALPNVIEDHLIGYQLFNHIDFIFANDVSSILYFDVINLLNEHNGFDPITSTSSASTTKTTTKKPTTKTTQVTSSGDGSSPDVTTNPSTTPSSASSLYPHNTLQAQFGVMLIVIYLFS